MDIPKIFNISESAHRIHNPFTDAKFATLGAVLRLEPETRILYGFCAASIQVFSP